MKFNKKNLLTIFLILCLSMVFLTVSSCKKRSSSDDSSVESSESQSVHSGTESESHTESTADGDITYTITLARSGGEPFTNKPMVARDADGKLKGYALTDENGKASFDAPAGTYYLQFGQLPEGYDGEKNYVISDSNPNATFKLSASLISEPAESNIKYNLGSVMHDFTFTDSTGASGSLSKLFETKKAVLLNFWFVNCSWCITEFPDMKSAYSNYSDDIAVIGVNFTDGKADCEAFRTNSLAGKTYNWNELPFIMLGRENECCAQLATSFSVTGCPTSVIIDREGVVCFIGEGAADEGEFTSLFRRYTAEPYEQKIFYNDSSLIDTPDVSFPTSQEIENAINANGYNFTYYFDNDTYNWPWVVDGDCIKASNTEHNNSYAILYTDVDLVQGQVLAFDYKTSSEKVYDEFYVFIDGVITHSFSGVMNSWKTCYAYSPVEESGTYTVSLVYVKDSGRSAGEDTIYVKNVRIVDSASITEPTEILQSCTWGKIVNNKYSKTISPVYNESDGYYHVGSENGPLVLANLMNATNWSTLSAWSYVMSGGFTYDLNKDGTAEDLTSKFTLYCNYANYSAKYGFIAVTEELKGLLDAFTHKYGAKTDNEWLELCYYYTVFAQDELKDPVIGLTYYTAYEAYVNNTEEDPVYNHVDKSGPKIPRGIWYKFVPSKTGIYRVHSVGEVDTYCWITTAELYFPYLENFGKDGYDPAFIVENDDDPNFVGDPAESGNFSVTMLFEAGKTYYILAEFNNIDSVGGFDYLIDYLAVSGQIWRATSANEYTADFDEYGNMTNVRLLNAVDYVLGDDDCYHVKNEDSTAGALIYIDLTGYTGLFPNVSVEGLTSMFCYYCKECGTAYYDTSTFEIDSNEDIVCCGVCQAEGIGKFEKRKVFELPTVMTDNEGVPLILSYKVSDEEYAYVPMYELDTEETVTDKNYLSLLKSGTKIKFTDYTSTIAEFVTLSKDEANYPAEEEVDVENASHMGCIGADAELVDILNKLILFGDIAFSPDMTNVWLRMAYYYLEI